MNEGAPENNEEVRKNVIKKQALLDAMVYVKLMQEKSPESLKFDERGEIILDNIGAQPIMSGARKNLGLNDGEMAAYLISLGHEVERILKSGSNLMGLN